MEEIVSYLAFCDLYIGVSFHGAITAFCYGNPVVGFDFVHNKKTRDLYDQLGLSEQYVSDESMLHDGIKCAFANGFGGFVCHDFAHASASVREIM